MIKLALFGTYTIVAVGLGELRRRLSRTRLPRERMALDRSAARRRAGRRSA